MKEFNLQACPDDCGHTRLCIVSLSLSDTILLQSCVSVQTTPQKCPKVPLWSTPRGGASNPAPSLESSVSRWRLDLTLGAPSLPGFSSAFVSVA